ncbi:D-amino acid dehydrogenase [Dirofilaria immitis]
MVGFYKCVDCEAYFERGRLLLYNKVFGRIFVQNFSLYVYYESTELLSTEYELPSVQVSSTELPSTVLPSVELKSTKLASTELPSVTIIKEDETSTISSMERKNFSFIEGSDNPSITIQRIHHNTHEAFIFLDAKESEIIRFIVIPGAAEFKLVCANRPAAATATTFKNNSYKKSYEFVIVFSSVGIMLMPNNWILSKHIPVNRKLTFEYFPGFERTRIEVRLLDSEGKMAIDILIMILKNIIYIRRRAIDPWYFAPCNNKYFTGPKLGKLEISIFSNRFTIGLRVNTEDNKMDMLECTIYGNLVNSDGIQEAIFSSTNPYTIVYAQYIYSMNLY